MRLGKESEMAKEDKDKIPMTKATSSEEFIIKLWTAVAKREMTMPEAEKQLHEYVNGLPEEKQDEFRKKARLWGQWLMQITEAFSQQLTVIGAGQ